MKDVDVATDGRAAFWAGQFARRLARSSARPEAEFRIFVKLYRVPADLQCEVWTLAVDDGVS